MEDLGFKIVRTNSGDELIARIGNYEIARQHSRRRFLSTRTNVLECAKARVILKI
jgi:hypothetical protein